MRPRFVSAAALLACSASPAVLAPFAYAQGVEEVVITSSPFAVSLESVTTNVDVLDRFDLDSATPGGLGDALGAIPGIRSSFFGQGASRPVIRGLAGPRVQVLTNGIGLIDASALSPDHQVASDPGEATRIEVLRGPAALAYGGSAIGGVVNVIDERVARSPAIDGMEGRANFVGTPSNQGFSLSGSVKLGEGPIVVTADALQRRAEDYDIPGFAESRYQIAAEEEEHEEEHEDEEHDDTHEEISGTVVNSAVRLTSLGAGVSWVAPSGFVGVSLRHTDTWYGVPGHAHAHEEDEGDAVLLALADDGEEEDDAVKIGLEQIRVDLHGEWDIGFGPFALVRIASGYSDYEHAEWEGGGIGTRFLSDGYEARLELVQQEKNGWQGAAGVQHLVRNFDAIGDEAYVPKTTIAESGAFTLQRLDLGDWGFEGGARLDTRNIDSLSGERDFTNVSLSAGAFLRPSQSWFLGLSLARTARAPSEVELFADGPHVATRGYEIGNPGLSSEIAWSADASAHVERGRFSADAHLFAAHYDGFIDLMPTGDEEDGLAVFRYTQGDADFHGFEVELGYRVWEEAARQIRVEAVADYVRGSTDNGPPARIPPVSLTGRMVFESERWTFEAEARHVTAQTRLASFELPTDAFTLVGLSAEFRPGGEGLSIFAGVDNLFNEEAREHASFLKDLAPLAGRAWRFGAAWRF
jgi:iron complex outermembrane receptor protein